MPGQDAGKQIVYQTLKASIYGVDIKEIPHLERKVNAFCPSDKKTRKLIMSSLCLNRYLTKNCEESKNKAKIKQFIEINKPKGGKV